MKSLGTFPHRFTSISSSRIDLNLLPLSKSSFPFLVQHQFNLKFRFFSSKFLFQTKIRKCVKQTQIRTMAFYSSEIFEIFDSNNSKIGTSTRDRVHSQGLFHRSVNILLFNSKGEILIQKRVSDKDVCPDCWDVSAAEHLKPGETHFEGAIRGLKEELGIEIQNPKDLTLFRPIYLSGFEFNDGKIKDYEWKECWKLTYDGELKPDPVEVAQIQFVSVSNLKQSAKENRAKYTPWFLELIPLIEDKKTH